MSENGNAPQPTPETVSFDSCIYFLMYCDKSSKKKVVCVRKSKRKVMFVSQCFDCQTFDFE